MKRFKVTVQDKFEAFFETIEKARHCRNVLQRLKYDNIVISVTNEDVP